MPGMRILDPTAKKQTMAYALTPFTMPSRRIGILHNHKACFDRLAAALPQALTSALHADTVETHAKERYSSGAPEALLQTLQAQYDLVLTGLAA